MLPRMAAHDTLTVRTTIYNSVPILLGSSESERDNTDSGQQSNENIIIHTFEKADTNEHVAYVSEQEAACIVTNKFRSTLIGRQTVK